MEFMPVGVFASIDAGLGVKLEVVRDLGIKTIQLHTPAKASRTPENAKAFLEKLSEYGITTTVVFLGFEGETYETIARTAETVGFVPEETRQARLQEAREIADFAKLLGVEAIGSHIGFVPHDTASDAYKGMVAAIQEYCDYLKKNGQRLHLETGQEKAENLLAFLHDVGRDNIFINFDPANLILYGMGNPIESLKKVGKYVRSCHCKDALPTTGTPGVDWGTEVPFGQGKVDAKLFLQTLKEIGYTGPLTIEREIPEEPERQKAEIGQALALIESIKATL
ncbi:MAG: sugar phosphate isomerase/epimerase [Thermoguttaceae bacterium]|nr:sugar phosphate isomerase/epimerase [Thermoguttaceae bacterium]MBQ3823418.1 sugar phosphate isomerase/epimerase [Thermoguttaceae bacterium]MBQ4204511.1 sugar phosphate isomerase/epimerase [Thermoguttaceae bacterium]MBQ5366794.1 sugar phosphate isomerase/epimerase [Thermoguttaceae bacterium]